MLDLNQVTVVKEFPDELLRISTDREIEFGIEVIPGMHPISIPPYKVVPTELKELKIQLRRLLEKGSFSLVLLHEVHRYFLLRRKWIS